MSELTNPASGAGHGAAAYTRSVLALLGERSPLEVLAELPASLGNLLSGLGTARLQQPEAPGRWSMIEVVQHLADTELVFGWRFRLALAEERPALTGFDQDRWAERLGYRSGPIEEALEQLRVLRRGHLRLAGGLAPGDLERVAVHQERGEESVAHMLRMHAGHDLAHRRQLERIRQALTAT